jgi:hypothetical protein
MARLSALSGLVFFLASGAQAFVPSPLAKMPTMTKAAPRSKVMKMGDSRGILWVLNGSCVCNPYKSDFSVQVFDLRS